MNNTKQYRILKNNEIVEATDICIRVGSGDIPVSIGSPNASDINKEAGCGMTIYKREINLEEYETIQPGYVIRSSDLWKFKHLPSCHWISWGNAKIILVDAKDTYSIIRRIPKSLEPTPSVIAVEPDPYARIRAADMARGAVDNTDVKEFIVYGPDLSEV